MDGQIYCVEPGDIISSSVSSSGERIKATMTETGRTLAELRALLAQSHKEVETGCAPEANDVINYLETSTTYFNCVGDHYIENDSYRNPATGQSDTNLYNIAFKMSWREDENIKVSDWTRLKQLIVWDSIMCMKEGFSINDDVRDATEQEKDAMRVLNVYAGRAVNAQEAMDGFNMSSFNPSTEADYEPRGYQGFMEEVKANNDTVVKEDPVTINEEDFYIDVDQEAKTVAFGPISLDYIDGRVGLGTVAVGGISDMYLLDQDGNKIDIDYFGYYAWKDVSDWDGLTYVEVDNEHKYNTFFSAQTPDNVEAEQPSGEENVNLMDWFAFGKVYPLPNQEFFIKFSYEDEVPLNLKVHVDFKWLECKVELCFREGTIYYIDQTHQHSQYHTHTYTRPNGSSYTIRHHGRCEKDPFINEADAQGQVYIVSAERIWRYDELEFEVRTEDGPIPFTMKLGGKVFEDANSGKENMGNGTLGEEDKSLANIKVTLYEVDENGELTLAELATREEENSEATDIDDKADWSRRINPTITDEYGYYEFRGVNLGKKYVVMFTYDGQNYLPTQYLSTDGGNTSAYGSVQEMVEAGAYSSVEDNQYWLLTSKGTELTAEREAYTERYAEIGSEPKSYVSTNSLDLGRDVLTRDGEWYNRTFTNYKLMGYELTTDGYYEQSGTQLIDGYLYDENGYLEYDESGKITSEWREGAISTAIKEFIDQNRKYPNDDELKQIYSEIAGGDTEVWQMLQFIEDTKIDAYSKNQNASNGDDYDQYPVYDQFTIKVADGNRYPNNSYEESDCYHEGTYNGEVTEYSNHDYYYRGTGEKYITPHTTEQNHKYHILTEMGAETTIPNVYPGQLQINLGLAIRQDSDLTLRKDLYRAVTQINGKTEVYKYDKRENEDADFWDIHLRIQDYENYYNSTYDRALFPSDHEFAGQNGGDLLEVYVTYQIIVRNQSQSTVNQVMELVDYYDEDYDFMPDLSWVTLERRFDDDQYYDMMHYTGTYTTIDNAESVDDSDTSRYGDVTEYDLGSGYQNVYINGLERYNLQSGDSAYIYLTFKVKGEGSDVILDDENSLKYNYVEINGYRTYYRDNTQLPNYGIKNETDSAGLIDVDSTAGSLSEDDLQEEDGMYEHHFEDDTDRSKGLRLFVDESLGREANGVVWEDERTMTVGDSIIGDGIRDEDNEVGISGVTVKLIEKCTNGEEYEWQSTTTDENGNYSFSEFIPGDYVIRFGYGDTDATLLTTADGGSNPVSYNGQDFKSTLYQTGFENNENRVGIDQDTTTDSLNRYYGYVNTAGQNVTGTYNPDQDTASSEDTFGYDISAADTAGINYSDAKDLWTADGRNDLQGREEVIPYSNENVTNHKAEVLASPYDKPAYTDNLEDVDGNETEYTEEEMRDLYNELRDNTQMTAETGIIAVEFEYDRIQTDGDDDVANEIASGENDTNGNYTLANIDFGLVERPKAQLEIDKSVENVQVTLINGTILFDINEAANNALWQDHQEYNLDEEKIDAEDHAIQDGEIGMYEEYYGDDDKHRYSFREEIDDLVTGTDKGLIQLTMDEELMHGATIQVTYIVKVTNVGEVDYVDNGDNKDFYYLGETAGTSVSTTTVNQIVDYVQNNLQYDANSNTDNGRVNTENGWELTTVSDLLSQELVNSKLETNSNNRLSQFNTILINGTLNTALEPGEEISKTLILSQMITPENTEDDLTYGNMVEILQTSNTVGRRMAYSVVGNQDPLYDDASEVDTNIAERIIILTPFGEVHIFYILIAVVAIILIVGIVLIRKFVLLRGKKE